MFVGRRGGDGMVQVGESTPVWLDLGFPVTLSEGTGPLESSFTHL